VPDAVDPPYTFTVTDDESPAAVPAVPENAEVRLLVTLELAGCASEIDGAVASTVNVFALLRPVLPAASLWLACAV
jgi:hypothetical protein